MLAAKTGAFQVVISDDPRLLLPDRLPQFDALVMNNIHERDPFLPEDFAKLGDSPLSHLGERWALAHRFFCC